MNPPPINTIHPVKMKTILEFGVKGGSHIDNLVFPSAILASHTAVAIVNMLENDPHATHAPAWAFPRGLGRCTWENDTHFVAITRMDGKLRGSASAGLWRKDNRPLMKNTVLHEI
jgi:hypothetical protein